MKAKNLDVRGTSQHAENASVKDVGDNRIRSAHFSSLGALTTKPCQHHALPWRHYRPGGTRYITNAQATNIIEAVHFAKSLGLPLVAHLTIHWACTDIGDDPDGKLFAKFREGLSKWTHRHGFDLTAACRPRMVSGVATTPPEHSHGSPGRRLQECRTVLTAGDFEPPSPTLCRNQCAKPSPARKPVLRHLSLTLRLVER